MMRDWQTWLERSRRVAATIRPYLDVERYALTRLKWGFSGIALVWLVLFGLLLLPGPTGDFGHRSASYRAASEKCEGSFASRYECKSGIIIDGENAAFYAWTWRLVLLLGPPTGLFAFYHIVARRRERERAEEARKRSTLRHASMAGQRD